MAFPKDHCQRIEVGICPCLEQEYDELRDPGSMQYVFISPA